MQKTLLLVNNFITNTGIFLNNFSNCCETKLSDVSLRINRIEITLSLLEAKLGSLPEDVVGPTPPAAQTPQRATRPASPPPCAQIGSVSLRSRRICRRHARHCSCTAKLDA